MKTQGEHIRTLRRRIDFLKTRDYRNSYDQAELGALEWALVNLPPAQQEPVAAQSVMTVRIWRDKNSDQNAEFKNWHKLPDGEHILYTSPPAQRTWVGLTDEDFQAVCKNFRISHGGWIDMLVLEIEAKLKEKNT